MNEKGPSLEGAEGDKRFRLEASVLAPQQVREIVERYSDDPIRAGEEIGQADMKARLSSEKAGDQSICQDAANTYFAGWAYLRLMLMKNPAQLEMALTEKADLAAVEASVQAVRERNDFTSLPQRYTMETLYTQARQLLEPSLKALAQREIERLR